jgi:hypothetical protein
MKKQKKSIPMIAFTVDMQENGLHTYVMNVKEKKLINYLNGYAHALQSAYQGLSEGGIPIGAALIVEDEVVATGYIQSLCFIRHFLHVLCVQGLFFFIKFQRWSLERMKLFRRASPG